MDETARVVASFVGLSVAALAILIAPLAYRRHDRGRYGWFIAAGKLLVVAYSRLWCRLRLEGPGTIPPEGPVIIAANHTVSVDPLLLSAACPSRYISFVIAEEYATLPLLRRLVNLTACIPVKRDGMDAGAMRTALRHLRAGYMLGIFPEGRIAPPGEKLPPKEGVAMLALRSGAPLIPVHIGGTVYSNAIFFSAFLPHKARVTVGQPVDLSPHRASMRNRATIAAAANEILRRIHELPAAPKAKRAAAPHPQAAVGRSA